ncbi:MAG: hypothetical protein ACTSW1_00665 [Candidatus Hodarchaeales archaeon]
MFSISKVLSIIALMALGGGILGTLILDVFIMFSDPKLGFEFLIKDIARTVYDSQGQISQAVKSFSPANEPSFNEFLFYKILTGSAISIGLIFLIYKAFAFVVPSVSADLGSKILVLTISVGIIWGISLLYSVMTTGEFILPFNGWIDLIKNSKDMRFFLEQKYSSKINQTINESLI